MAASAARSVMPAFSSGKRLSMATTAQSSRHLGTAEDRLRRRRLSLLQRRDPKKALEKSGANTSDVPHSGLWFSCELHMVLHVHRMG